MDRTEVLIVGAGPTGLLLAVELRRRGIDCLLIDAHDAPLGWDRATIVHARSIEIFEGIGLADPLIDAGVKIRTALIRSGGEVVAEIDPRRTGSRYSFDLGLSEETTERVLTDELVRLRGGVTRSTRLNGFRVEDDSVIATLEGPGFSGDVEASWLVGCDGLRSTVREAAGIAFPGSDIEQPWAVFDAGLDGWDLDPDIQAAHLDTRPVILTPLPGERYRIYLRPSNPEADLEAEALEILDAYSPGVALVEPGEGTCFQCHSRVAERFRAGPVLLAGDAAHACTPGEGHGMNTGLQDAFNLGWKLALACRGFGSDVLVESYEAERRPVATRVVESGAATEAGMTLAAASDRAERNRGISEAFGDPEGMHREAVAAAELDRSYASSPIVPDVGAKGTPGTGRRLPDTGPVRSSEVEASSLHEFAQRTGHTVLVVSGPVDDGRDGGDADRLVDEIAADVDGSGAVDAVLAVEAPAVTADELGIDGIAVFVIRPDRYIGLRLDRPDPSDVGSYVRQLAG